MLDWLISASMFDFHPEECLLAITNPLYSLRARPGGRRALRHHPLIGISAIGHRMNQPSTNDSLATLKNALDGDRPPVGSIHQEIGLAIHHSFHNSGGRVIVVTTYVIATEVTDVRFLTPS